MEYDIAVLGGDGIGPEVTEQSVRVLMSLEGDLRPEPAGAHLHSDSVLYWITISKGAPITSGSPRTEEVLSRPFVLSLSKDFSSWMCGVDIVTG